MKERTHQKQEPRFPDKQEIHIAPQTTFKKLGIEDLREKRLSLDNEQIAVIAVKDYQNNSWTFLAAFNHPFVSAHLAHFLNAEAAVQVDPAVAKQAILADFNMPRMAARPRWHATDYRTVELHKMHEGDPEIRLHYKEFVKQGLEQQTNALKNSKYDNLFNQAMQLAVVNHQAVEKSFLDLLAKLKSERILGNTNGEIFRSLQRAPIERHYSQFLRLRAKYKFDTWSSFETQAMQIIPKFLKKLDNEGQKQLLIARTILSPYATAIDPSTKEIFGTRYDGVDLSFSNDSIEVTDNNGNSIQIKLQEDSQDLYFPYRTVSYRFAEEPLQDALYAVIAWNNQDGQRRFLSQNELLDFLPRLNFDRSKRPDAYLGRNLLGYFSKDITDKWPKEIALEGHPRPQKIMGAQVSVRDSLDSDKYPHARQLLKGSVTQKLEEHALALAA